MRQRAPRVTDPAAVIAIEAPRHRYRQAMQCSRLAGIIVRRHSMPEANRPDPTSVGLLQTAQAGSRCGGRSVHSQGAHTKGRGDGPAVRV